MYSIFPKHVTVRVSLMFCFWTWCAVEVNCGVKTYSSKVSGSYWPGGPRIPVRFFRSGGFGYSLIDGALNGVLQGAYIHWNVSRQEAWQAYLCSRLTPCSCSGLAFLANGLFWGCSFWLFLFDTARILWFRHILCGMFDTGIDLWKGGLGWLFTLLQSEFNGNYVSPC